MNPYLLTGCGLLVLMLALSGAMLKRAWGENATLETRLASANEVIQQREKDMALNAKAVAQLAEKLATTEAKVVTVTERIYSAPKTVACVEQPSIRASILGVRDIYADPVPAGGGRQLAAPVPAPGAVGGNAQR